MKKKLRNRWWISAVLILMIVLSSCGTTAWTDDNRSEQGTTVEATDTQGLSEEETLDEHGTYTSGEETLDEHGTYTSAEDVALYINTYGNLPDNFITKSEAREQGWDGGSLEPYCPGCCIGGDRFGNREGLLPEADGRTYLECDINTLGAEERGAERLVFSNDGLIYYTEDHYESFTLLYGDE